MNQTVETYALATLGAAEGLARYGPRTLSGRAWAAMGLGILAYELACPAGETLSEGVDRALESHPALTTLAIGATALHLANRLPERLDPFHRLFKTLKETV